MLIWSNVGDCIYTVYIYYLLCAIWYITVTVMYWMPYGTPLWMTYGTSQALRFTACHMVHNCHCVILYIWYITVTMIHWVAYGTYGT